MGNIIVAAVAVNTIVFSFFNIISTILFSHLAKIFFNSTNSKIFRYWILSELFLDILLDIIIFADIFVILYAIFFRRSEIFTSYRSPEENKTFKKYIPSIKDIFEYSLREGFCGLFLIATVIKIALLIFNQSILFIFKITSELSAFYLMNSLFNFLFVMRIFAAVYFILLKKNLGMN